jgi:hypothetical protein
MDGARARLRALRPARASLPPLLLVGGITAAGLLLRWPSFTDALFGDEVTTYGVVSGHGPRAVLDLVHSDIENTPPLFYLVAAATERVGGSAEALRLPSLLAGVTAIPLTYWLGTLTVGRRAGVTAAALMAVSPYLIFYSTEARSYALVMLLALLSTLALLYALQRGGLALWIAYGAVSCASLYASYTALFILLAQLAWALVVHRDAWRPLLGANLGAAIGFLPWLPGFLKDSDSPTNVYDYIRTFSLDVAREDLVHWSVGHPYIDVEELSGQVGIWLIVAGLGLGAAGLLAGLLRRPAAERSWRPSPPTVLVILLAAVVPVGAAIYSMIGSTVFTPRYLIPSWPGLALAAGALLTSARGWHGLVPAAICVGGLAIGGVRMTEADHQRPDYESVAEFIEAEGPPNGPIAAISSAGWGPQTTLEAALGPPHDFTPGGHRVFIVDPAGGLGYPDIAARHGFLHREISILYWSELSIRLTATQQARLAGRLARGGRIYFVSEAGVRAGGLDPDPPPPEFLRALPPGYRVVETRSFPGLPGHGLKVYALERAPA